MLHIGVLQFDMEIRWSQSLKDKRGVLRSLKDRIRRKFNVSISEIEEMDNLTLARLGAVQASNDAQYLQGALEKLLQVLKTWPDAELVDYQIEIL